MNTGAIVDFIGRGGVLMVPILGASVLALAVFLERLWSLRSSVVAPAELVRTVEGLVVEGRLQEAVTVCESHQTPFSRVVLAGMALVGRKRELVQGALEEQGRREVARLERFLGVVGTVAAVAPLMGLLGTVSGMISVFRQVVEEVAVQGQVHPGSLANGIWEALITTAAGLTVAIPAFIGHRLLLSRVDGLALVLEESAGRLLPHMEGLEVDGWNDNAPGSGVAGGNGDPKGSAAPAGTGGG